ncbi:S-adenosylmethionine synthetase [Sphaerobacter thermophilus DSM 20745]|uniref:S-adenosylmethionine synthase n=2 Tax=Sphaerobacter TaxID=2056 RepID=D1C2U1_SPHTD|nr:methionine adenosyltransferase [Sphaerobacter thermophilus]ACZ38558.1 S-adenosylmethionine synthetase [Sphaerobacter thermophilus DSM 20745]
MTTSFMRAAKTLFTSESVTEGHPDKLCDQISDAVLDAILAEDADARVACETAATTGLIFVFGEITTSTYVDIPAIARQVVEDVGYTRAKYGFDATTAGVITSIKEQSPEIAQAVDLALEVRDKDGGDGLDAIGAGDQGMMIGFACTETPELMPLPISLAHALTRRMAAVRKSGELGFLRPDGKSQVTVEYRYGRPARVDTIVLAAQHDPGVTNEEIQEGLREVVVKAVVPDNLLDNDTRVLINPSGRFSVGGPMGDAGLTGRKIIVDTYGGMARHGGGAFSGKDPTKVDRSGAYAARYVAKNVVAAGLADRFEIQISYAIGVAQPVSLHIETFGTARIDEERILELIRAHFDLRPGAIIRDLDLMRPIYRQVAAYGHFGRPDLDLPWERTDKAALLRDAAGLTAAEIPVGG